MIIKYRDYKKPLKLDLEDSRPAVVQDPPSDEKVQAKLNLLLAISSYEITIIETKIANKVWDEDQSEENAQAVREAVDRRDSAGAELKDAIKKMNILDGKKPYAELEILGIKWKPTKGNLPYRY